MQDLDAWLLQLSWVSGVEQRVLDLRTLWKACCRSILILHNTVAWVEIWDFQVCVALLSASFRFGIVERERGEGKQTSCMGGGRRLARVQPYVLHSTQADAAVPETDVREKMARWSRSR
jgi:hypothetical protein